MTTARTLGIMLALIPSLYAPTALAKPKKNKDAAAQKKPSVDEWGQEETPVPGAAPSASTKSTSSEVAGDRATNNKPAEAKAEEKPVKAAEVAPASAPTAQAEPAPAPAPVPAAAPAPAPEVVAPTPPKNDLPASGGVMKSTGNADSPEGVTWKASGWDVTLYGYAALNVMQDSTQSFGTSSGNSVIVRRGTIRGNRLQAQATSRDSRLGLRLSPPKIGSVKSSVNLETDFNAPPPVEYTEANSVTNAAFRMRHYYMKVETPVVDFIAGQYHDLFGWGGKGFYPSTLAFLGITGEIYHRQPQIRLSKIMGAGKALEFEVAGAVLRPVQKNGGYPDVEAGVRLAFNNWTGARQQAYGQPGIGAAGIGVSAIGRHFEVAQFLEFPGDTVPGNGYGIAGNVFLPIIPAHNNADRGNSLSITGEYSRGTGIGDMYGDLSGGLLFPSLPNPQDRQQPTNPPPVYTPNIDSGIVTFDGDNRLRTCDWEGIVAGLQYYLPIFKGRWWISGNFAQAKSANIAEITPIQGRGGVYTRSRYYDGNLFIAITDAIQMGFSFQQIDQVLGDGVKTQNRRTEFGMHMFF
jgi:hypothetical protein